MGRPAVALKIPQDWFEFRAQKRGHAVIIIGVGDPELFFAIVPGFL